MPYVIAVYDVSVRRVQKALRLFRRYLSWVQNSVFEGELTKAQLAELEAEVHKLFQDGDSLILYELRTKAYSERRTIGEEPGAPGVML